MSDTLNTEPRGPEPQGQNDARTNEIMRGFRANFPDYADMSDKDILVGMYQKHYSDLSPEEFYSKMSDRFAPSNLPLHAAHGPSVKQRVDAAGKVIAAIPGQLAHGIVESAVSPAKMVEHAMEGKRLENIAQSIPAPNIEELRKRGYSEQQIHNLVHGYTDTQNSLMGDIEQEGKAGVKATGEAAATYATLPFGGPVSPANVTGKLAAPVIAKAATHGAVEGVVRSAITGGLFGAGYGSINQGVVNGADAAAKGASTSDILNAMTSGAVQGGIQGAKYGAVGGAVLHTIGSGVVAGTRVVGDGVTALRSRMSPQWASRAANLDNDVKRNTAVAMNNFATNFNPRDLISRYKADYDAWQGSALNAPPELLASTILARLFGQEAVAGSPEAVQGMVQKMQPWLEAQEKLNPTVPLPSLNAAANALGTEVPQQPLAQPNSAELASPLGVPPENLPPSVQGPISEAQQQFVPPTDATRGPDVDGNILSTQQPLPVQPTPITPDMNPNPPGVAPMRGSTAQTMNPAIDIQRLVNPNPAEIAPRLPETTPTPLPEGRVPAGTAEPLDLRPPTNKRTVTPEVERVNKAIHKISTEVRGLSASSRRISGAIADVAPSPDGTHILIRSLRGSEHGTGASGKALDAIIKEADKEKAPIQVIVHDHIGLRGGKIAATKIADWYESKGFQRQGDPDAAGSITLVRPVKE